MIRRVIRLIAILVLSVTVVAGVAWGKMALWFDGPQSCVLAGTMAGGLVLVSILLVLLARSFLRGLAVALLPVAAVALVDVGSTELPILVGGGDNNDLIKILWTFVCLNSLFSMGGALRLCSAARYGLPRELRINRIGSDIRTIGPGGRAELVEANLTEKGLVAQRLKHRAEELRFKLHGSGNSVVELHIEPVAGERRDFGHAVHRLTPERGRGASGAADIGDSFGIAERKQRMELPVEVVECNVSHGLSECG
jgi:hypothetical protein